MKRTEDFNDKPNWWPENPYPKEVFPMERSEYPKIVPDDKIRTALSGCLGRTFWEMASDAIWERYKEYARDKWVEGTTAIRTAKGE